MSTDAHRRTEASALGPQTSLALRDLLGKRRYERAMAELRGALLVTAAEVEERPSGWPAAIVDLTCRRFDVGGRHDPVYA
ncbi:MAG: hypothetical protein ACRDN9_19495, partial [Streptosporangiaceae bacterium]